MNRDFMFSAINIDELAGLISDELAKRMQVSNPSENKLSVTEDYISRDAVCKMLGISLVTLNKHRRTKRLISYRIGGRVLYKRSEVESSLKKFD